MSGESDQTNSDESVDADLARALPRLTVDQIARVSTGLLRETYRSGQEIVSQGDQPDSFYIIIDGEVEVCHENLEGEIEVVDTRRPGDYFGEIGLLKGWPRSATVRAPLEGEVEVLAMGREDFQRLMDQSRGTESQVAREMIHRLIQLADHQ